MLGVVVARAKIVSMRFVDVSHSVEHGMLTYPGLPGPLISDFLSRDVSRASYSEGTEFQIGKIEMIANAGTYVDSPFYRFAEGKDLAELPLTSLAYLDCVVVRPMPGASRAIGAGDFADCGVNGKAVLVATGWDRHWRTPQYFHGHPFLTKDAADFLVNSGAVLVGIDSLNIDDTGDGAQPVHTTLLGADVPIVEHLCRLDRIPEGPSRFTAVPVKVGGFGSFPVRAFAGRRAWRQRF